MLQVIKPTYLLFATSTIFSKQLLHLQAARCARKPRWLPTAKSKVFRVPPRPNIPEDEKVEMKRLFNNYRTQMKSINRYLTLQYNVEYHESFDADLHEKKVKEDFVRCSDINEQWNLERKTLREQRISGMLEKEKEKAKNRLQERLQIKQAQLEEAENIVRREIKNAKTFVTPENLDAAIQFAIANPVDYNFAIDLQGNKIYQEVNKKSDGKIMQ